MKKWAQVGIMGRDIDWEEGLRMRYDCHIHMILDGVYYRGAIDHQKQEPDRTLIRARLAAYRDAGIRYLRDGGDKWGVGKCAAELAGEFDIEYRTPIFPIHKKGRYGGFIGCGFDTPDEYAELVRRAKAQGADFIKIMISGLMDFERFGTISCEPLTSTEIRRMIEIAHGEGMAVMAHANGAETVKAAVDAGVDSIEHGAYLDDEAIRMLARSETVWTPTAVTIANLIGQGRYPDEVLRPLLEMHLNNVRRCAELGGRIAPGSDNGAYRVAHVQGTLDEYALLQSALGEDAEHVLTQGAQEIQRRFRP